MISHRPAPLGRRLPVRRGSGDGAPAEPVFAAVEAVEPPRPLFLLDPGGRRFDQDLAAELAATSGFSLLCGRYEGVDERVRRHLVDGELSIGDFVLAGGEAAAFVIVEAVTRLVPGVMGNDESAGRVLHLRPARVPPLHPAGRVAGIERPRDPPLGRSRAHRPLASRPGPGPHRAHRPDLLAARGGLTADEEALLESFGLGYPGQDPGNPAQEPSAP